VLEAEVDADVEIAVTPGATGGGSDPDGSVGFDSEGSFAFDLRASLSPGVARDAGLESTRLIFTLPTPFSVRPISSAARLDRSILLPFT
jgi:hypothetical protein